MTLGYDTRRRYLTLAFVAILSLELVLIGEHMKPVSGFNKKDAIAFKSILSLLFLLKSKKPKIGFIPIPLPLPIPIKVEKKEEPVTIKKNIKKIPIVHNIPEPVSYPEYYPVEQAPSYIDGGYEGGYGGDEYGGGYGGGY